MDKLQEDKKDNVSMFSIYQIGQLCKILDNQNSGRYLDNSKKYVVQELGRYVKKIIEAYKQIMG